MTRNLYLKVDRPQSYESLERFAVSFRNRVAPELPRAAPFPCLEVFEQLHSVATRTASGLVVQLDYEVRDLSEAGRTHFEDDRFVVALSKNTYEELLEDDHRARFTVCHEVGHAACHGDELVRMSCLPDRVHHALTRMSPKRHPVYQDSEWQADAFAGALLMPACGINDLCKEINRWPRPIDLVRCFNVSLSAAETRLRAFEKHHSQLVARC